MVIDFSRLNSAPPLTGSTRSNASQETGSATQAAPAQAERTGSAVRASAHFGIFQEAAQ